jgi:hypothetical protein
LSALIASPENKETITLLSTANRFGAATVIPSDPAH